MENYDKQEELRRVIESLDTPEYRTELYAQATRLTPVSEEPTRDREYGVEARVIGGPDQRMI